MRRALLKTLAFHHTWNHAPTLAEWLTTLEWENDLAPLRREATFTVEALLQEGRISTSYGRYALGNNAARLIVQQRDQELWLARKLHAAQAVTRWLARLSSVRFVAVCNSTALGHAQNEADLDFFVVAKAGTIMLTRGFSTLPWRFLHQRPGDRPVPQDPVCLSYFVADDGLDLSAHMLTPDDPYFRYWFLSLMPLFDDGVGEELWQANSKITARFPLAEQWLASPDLRLAVPRVRIPMPQALEASAARFQSKRLPEQIRGLMNRDTRVMVTPQVLKFHVGDRREAFRERHLALCKSLGV